MPDVGIPEGLRISIGGNIFFIDELGGTITVEFETSRFRKGEALLIFIDGEEKFKFSPSNFDTDGYSKKQHYERTYELNKGEHLVQFSVESRIEPEVIANFYESKKDNHSSSSSSGSSLAEAAIKSIIIKGSSLGGAYSCEPCPMGTIALEG